MLDKEYDPELDAECLTANERLTCLSKVIERILGRVKLSESPSVQGTKNSEEDIVVRERAQ